MAQDWHEEERTYEYDNLNRLVKVVFYNGIIYEYQYDNLGNRLGKTIDVQLPQNNYSVSTVGLTCINSSDGIIHLEADRKNTYNIEIDSPDNSFNESHVLNSNNDWELNIDYLEGGEYFIHITIDGISEDMYKKTFILNLDEPEPLEATSRMANDGNRFTVEMITGTPPFTIKLNDEIIGATSENEFTFEAQHGDMVEVSTVKACEGKYIETLSVLDAIALHPNPTSDKVYFSIPAIENGTAITLQLYDINGRLVGAFAPIINNQKIEISIQHLPTGVYVANFPAFGDTTFKIIKE